MANICRLCGNCEAHTIFIFGNEGLKHDIDLKIRVALDIQLFPNDPLPKHACICCLGKLDEFLTFQNHCRKVQTYLRRLLPERVPFQFQNINGGQHRSPKTSTEENSAAIEVLGPFRDITDNYVNNPGVLNSIINERGEVEKEKVETHSDENSNDSLHSYDEPCENECEPCENDPYLLKTDLLVATQNGNSVAAGQFDSCIKDKEDNMAITAAGYTSETALEDNFVPEEGGSEVQDKLVSEEPNTENIILQVCGTVLSVNNNTVDSHLCSAGSHDSLLMNGQTLKVLNPVLSTTTVLTDGKKTTEDRRCKDSFSVNNDLNLNPLQAPNIIHESSNNVITTNKRHHLTKGADNTSRSSLGEEQTMTSGSFVTDVAQDMTTDVVNNVTNNEKEVACHSVMNSLQHLLLERDMACKTTNLATVACIQSISAHDVRDEEITVGDAASCSSQQSVIITDQSLNHPNHIGRCMSSAIEVSRNESSRDDNPGNLLEKGCNTIAQISGQLTRHTQFSLNVVSDIGDSRPLEVMHSDAETALIQDQNMEISDKVSDLKDSVAVSGANQVQQILECNTASRSDPNTSHDSKSHSMNVNSGSSATCVHGIDASICYFSKCCVSHPLDKNWSKVGSDFRCLLCKRVFGRRDKIRAHVSTHVSLKLFECSICFKKFVRFESLISHRKTHDRKDDINLKVLSVYSCQNCSKTFNNKQYFRKHQTNICRVRCVTCADCGLRFSSLKRHLFNCPGKTGFVCDICNKSFKLKTKLIIHLRVHEQGEYACDKCEKIYSASRLLRNHQNAEHGTGKLKCTYCTKTFCQRARLDAHIVSHTGIRNYLCEICSKSFLNAGNLATHMKFHGKKNIKCYLCGKMYFRKNMLLSHMKNVHCK